MIRPILKMGSPSLLVPSRPVTRFDTPDLHALVTDLEETMAAADSAGIAAPRSGSRLLAA